MAKSPNTDPFNGYSTSWTQPYLPTSYDPFDTPKARVAGVNSVTEEMIRITAVDNIVDEMLTYPLALELITRAKEKK